MSAHGRSVAVRLDSGEVNGTSEVSVATSGPEFEAKSRDGRVRPGESAPAPIVAALKTVPNSTRWKQVKVEGGPEGIVVSHKGGEQSDWLLDLWLAERLASA